MRNVMLEKLDGLMSEFQAAISAVTTKPELFDLKAEYVGKKGKVSKVIEYKVETICPASKIKKIIQALKKSHPYEHPAFGALKLEEF